MIKNTKILKNGSIACLKKDNNKWKWRIIKGPRIKDKKSIKRGGGECKHSPYKTHFFDMRKSNVNYSNGVYYPNKEDIIKALDDFMKNDNKEIRSDILDNCICNGFKKFDVKESEIYDIKQFGSRKGVSGTPFGISKNNKILFVTKEIKLKSKSLTKKNRPFKRKYKYNENDIKLMNKNNIFLVYILSNYEVQTIIGLLVMMCTTEHRRIRQCILQTYDAFICKKRGFNLLEVATSNTLYDYFKLHSKEIRLKNLKRIFLQIFKTLMHLQNEIDFVHGDLKLSNIFCSGSIEENTFRIKIADLDIASATYKKGDDTIRVLSRKNSCYMFKKSKFKKYMYRRKYYFKTGINKLRTRCLISYNINNIDIAKILDLLICLINMLSIKTFREYIYENHINTLRKLLKKKNVLSKIDNYTEKEIKERINNIFKILKKFKYIMSIYYVVLGIFTISFDTAKIIKEDLIDEFEKELDMFDFTT